MMISDAPDRTIFRVLGVKSSKEVGKRLADMGFTEGAEGQIVRSGLLRDPLQVKIRGYDILIRRSEARDIEIAPVGEWDARERA